MAIIDARILRSLQLTETLSDKGDAQFTGSEDFLILSDTKDPSFADILDNQATWANLGNKRLPRLKDLIQVGGIDLYVNSRDLSHYKDNERAVVMSVRYVGKPEGPGLPEPQLLTPEFFQRWSIQTTSVTEPALGWETLAETNGKPQVGGGQKTAQNSAGDPVDGLEEDTSLLRMTRWMVTSIRATSGFSTLPLGETRPITPFAALDTTPTSTQRTKSGASALSFFTSPTTGRLSTTTSASTKS
jgi:hypothetical protein